MKTWLRNGLEILAVVLLLPQVFVFFYFFRFFFVGGNALGLLKTVAVYALTISWVSAPFLVALALAVKALISAKARWTVTLLLCVAAGYAWVAAWNLLVYPVFSYFWSALPILLCSVGFAGYAAARRIYLESLEPLKLPSEPAETPDAPAKNEAPDLSE
jgi:hypothetical protein